MANLLIRPEAFTGKIEDFGYDYLSFQARQLASGARYAANGERSNVFDRLPSARLITPAEVNHRMQDAVDPAIVSELLRKFRDFARAYREDEIKVDEFDSYGTTVRTLHHSSIPTANFSRSCARGVDCRGLVRWLKRNQCKAYVLVEQDVLPGMCTSKESARPDRVSCCIGADQVGLEGELCEQEETDGRYSRSRTNR